MHPMKNLLIVVAAAGAFGAAAMGAAWAQAQTGQAGQAGQAGDSAAEKRRNTESSGSKAIEGKAPEKKAPARKDSAAKKAAAKKEKDEAAERPPRIDPDAPVLAAGGVFKCVDRDGNITYGNVGDVKGCKKIDTDAPNTVPFPKPSVPTAGRAPGKAEGSDSTYQREEGFLETLKPSPGIEVVSSNQYGGSDVEGAYKKGESILSVFKKADGSLSVDGIFCPNESTTLAMMRVLEDNGWAGKVRFVGFDASDKLVQGMRDGHIDALVLQDPVRMGYLGVKTMVSHIRGEKVDRRIDTGARLVPRDQMDQPDLKALLHPDLSGLKDR